MVYDMLIRLYPIRGSGVCAALGRSVRRFNESDVRRRPLTARTCCRAQMPHICKQPARGIQKSNGFAENKSALCGALLSSVGLLPGGEFRAMRGGVVARRACLAGASRLISPSPGSISARICHISPVLRLRLAYLVRHIRLSNILHKFI